MKVLDLQTWINEFAPDVINLDKIEEYLSFLKEAVRRYDESRYSEWHHVIPKCVDKTSKFRDEGFSINGRDHVIAHRMLLDCFTHCDERRRLGYALHMMLRDPSGQRVSSLTFDEYEEIRKSWTESVTGFKRSKETCRKISQTLGDGRLKGKGHPLYGKHHSQETRDKISKTNQVAWTDEKRHEFSKRRKGEGNPCYGRELPPRTFSDETRQRMSESGRDKIWINDGTTSSKIDKDSEVPEGWVIGRLSFKRRSNGQEGKMWVNNGEVNRKILRGEIPEGFVIGRLRKVENQIS